MERSMVPGKGGRRSAALALAILLAGTACGRMEGGGPPPGAGPLPEEAPAAAASAAEPAARPPDAS
ncbi:MAG: hypothetical protein AB1346_10240, partial [Thermodesulfobacteriota bacterium]